MYRPLEKEKPDLQSLAMVTIVVELSAGLAIDKQGYSFSSKPWTAAAVGNATAQGAQ
jgi:hypothetical protein